MSIASPSKFSLLLSLQSDLFGNTLEFLQPSSILKLRGLSRQYQQKLDTYCEEIYRAFAQMKILQSPSLFAQLFQREILKQKIDDAPLFFTIIRIFKFSTRMLQLHGYKRVGFSAESIPFVIKRRYEIALFSLEKTVIGNICRARESIEQRDQRVYQVLESQSYKQKETVFTRLCTIGDPLPVTLVLQRLPNITAFAFGHQSIHGAATSSIINGHEDLFEALASDPRFEQLKIRNFGQLVNLAAQFNRRRVAKILVNHLLFERLFLEGLHGLSYAIWHASRRGHDQILRLLAQHPYYEFIPANEITETTESNPSLAECVCAAAEYGHFSTLQILAEMQNYLHLKANSDVNVACLARAIWAATKNKHKEIVYFLVKHPNYPKISHVKWNCLVDMFTAAVESGDLELFTFFTHHPNYPKLSPFGWVSLAAIVNHTARYGRHEMLEILTTHPKFAKMQVHDGHLCLASSLKDAKEKGHVRCIQILEHYCSTSESN